MGKANEVVVHVNGKNVNALLDTGSMVSTMALSLCQQMRLPIQPLDNLLTVHGAGGHQVPYEGYVQVNLDLPRTKGAQMSALMLVVPNTDYHIKVPILLGTNVLGHFTEVELQDPTWKNVMAMLARHQALTNNTESLGTLTITKPLTLPPNGRIVAHGHTRVQPICQKLTVCLDGTSGLPKGVMATPSVSIL